MDSNASDAVQTPATVLLASGVVLTLFYLVYAIWTGVGLVMGCMNVGLQGLALADGSDGAVFGLGLGMWGLVLSCVSVLFYAALAAGGAYVIKGALGMKNLQSLGGAKTAAIVSAVVPIVGIAIGALLSVVSLSCCGLVTGAIPQLFPLLLGIAGAGFAFSTLGDDAVASGFEAP